MRLKAATTIDAYFFIIPLLLPRLGWHVYSSRNKTPPAAFGGAEMCLRAEGLVGFRSSERRWSNTSTRAINISLLRSENRPSRKSLVDQLGAKLFGPFPLNQFFHSFR